MCGVARNCCDTPAARAVTRVMLCCILQGQLQPAGEHRPLLGPAQPGERIETTTWLFICHDANNASYAWAGADGGFSHRLLKHSRTMWLACMRPSSPVFVLLDCAGAGGQPHSLLARQHRHQGAAGGTAARAARACGDHAVRRLPPDSGPHAVDHRVRCKKGADGQSIHGSWMQRE